MAIAPPRPKGPPLTALRAFEAAARLGGFSRAAEELCVTPGAIAQQVKALEDWCGAALFDRQAQGVDLSRVGAEVLPGLTHAFDALGAAVGDLRQAAAPGRVHIAALPSIAQLWVSPRMPALRAALPGLQLSVTALETPPNLMRDPFDLTVFYGAGDGVRIAQDEIFPVCAPDVAERLRDIGDLADVPCLSDAVWQEDWARWLSACGCDLRVKGPVYSLYALAVEEAVHGAGVLMGHGALIERHLASGALVAPFHTRARLPRWLELRHKGGAVAPPLQALIGLLSGEGGLQRNLDHVTK
ncbi:LysR family transcriptional regulator [Shimia sp.]|uniref:LysR family transcriptional regulator n=1 Tax=Shimia sp. TaxID=1954381 RepID=UPI00328BEC49